MLHDHFTKSCKIQSTNGQRAFLTLVDTSELARRAPTPDTVTEASALFVSAAQRSYAMQKSWAKSWSQWLNFASALPGADTMSKLVALQSNIALQAQAQLSQQTTETLELWENIDVGYSYWTSQKLAELREAASETAQGSSAS